MSLLTYETNNIIAPNDNIIDEESTPKIPTFLTNIIFEYDNTDQIIKYYHDTMGCHVISTWCKSIYAGYFQRWPSFTSTIVFRNIKFKT